MMLVKALTQEEVEDILNQYRQRSQAIKESVFDLVLNSGGCLSLDDVYNMEERDILLMQEQLSKLIELKYKKRKHN